MTEAIFLADVSQVEAALRLQRRLGGGTALVTGDMAAAWELERRGVPFLDEHDLVTPEELLRNWEHSVELADRWWSGAEEIAVDGVPILSAAAGDLKLPLELALDATSVYRRLLAEHRIERAHVFFVPAIAICRQQPAPGAWAAASLSQAVLRWEAERAGAAVVPRRSFRPLAVEGRLRAAAAAGGHDTRRTVRGGAGERLALILDSGLREAECTLLERRLAAEARWRFVRLTPWELAPGGPLDAPWEAADAVRALARLADSGGVEGVLANPYLGFQLRRILGELASAARIAARFGALIEVLRPALCVLGHDAATVERLLVRTARQYGVPTVALIHGGFRPSRIYRDVAGEADRLLVWGAEDRDGLVAAGVDPGRIRIAGSILYEECYRTAPAEPAPSEQARARERLGVPPSRPVVLVLTATVVTGPAAVARPTEHRNAWRTLVDLARRRPDLTFALKPHPSYDHFELYRRIARDGPGNMKYLESVALAEALAAASVTVMINYATTAAMEGLLAGRPSIFWPAGLYAANSHDRVAAGFSEIVVSAAELEATVDRWLGSPEALDRAVGTGIAAVTSFLGDPAAPALDRVVAELEASRPSEREPVAGGAPDPERALVAAAHEIGACATDPASLDGALAATLQPLAAAGAVTAATLERARVSAFLAAVAARTAAGESGAARAFALRLLASSPRLVLAWPTVGRTVVRLLVEATAPGRGVVTLSRRLGELAARWRGGLRHQARSASERRRRPAQDP